MAIIKTWMTCGWASLAVAALVAGCETSSLNNEGNISLAELQGIVPATVTPATNTVSPTPATPPATDTPGETTPNPSAPVNPGFPAAIDGPIHWLNTDVSGWSQTASLSASVGGGTINMPYSKSRSWPARDGVNANPWVIVKWKDGQWYAATFEYFKFGQTSKPVGVLDGSKGPHIQGSPLNQWNPSHGEKFYLMVSGLARSSARNVQERSNPSLVTWP